MPRVAAQARIRKLISGISGEKTLSLHTAKKAHHREISSFSPNEYMIFSFTRFPVSSSNAWA